MNTNTTATGGTATLAGRPVARIGFGAMQLALPRPARPVPHRAAALALLRHAVDRGINHIDTAQFYGDGTSNELIRAALHPFDDALMIVTKVGAVRASGSGLAPAQRPEELRAQVETNLTTLGTDRLPVVNLRRLDAAPGIIAEGQQRVDLDSQLAELVALRDEGKLGAIGLSNIDAEQLHQALPAGLVCVQNEHSPRQRASEPVLDVCRKHDIAWVPFFPLGSAGLPGRVTLTEHPTVRAVAERLGVGPAQVVLAWHLAHYEHTLLIVGTTKPEHLEDNIAAGTVVLDESARRALDELAVDR